MFCCSSTICHSTHSLCVTVTLNLYYHCSSTISSLSQCFSVVPILVSNPHFASLSLAPSVSHFLFISVTLSVSSFPPFSSHTIPLLFSNQVRSFTGSPFSGEFDEDNQIAKFDIIACGLWKTNPSYINSQNCYLTPCPCISSLILLPHILVLFH